MKRPPPSYRLTRFLILRLLGAVYLVAFLVAARQIVPLVGSDGLTPMVSFLQREAERLGSRAAGFADSPSLFWALPSDTALVVVAWLGVGLSALVVLGFANAPLLALLWALYMSFVHVGQLWYSFGWEIQLLETGFLAIFLCPLVDPRPFPATAPATPVLWLHRWLIFRIMLGSALIKLRYDPCWRDLTCLDFHYETQPLPNPLSPWFHFLPSWVHHAGVALNHMSELVAPWFAFGPRRARHAAGGVMLLFQVLLIASGNLSFLNYLTIVPILACFDDRLLARILPRRLVARADHAAASERPSRVQPVVAWLVVALIAWLSIDPVLNLVSSRQVMNTSFGRLDLVNTYGAFGSVGRERHEIVFEGTASRQPDGDAEWLAYEFRCKPGDPARRPCVVSPYHYRLDWLIWFAAMSTPGDAPWTVHLVSKLLQGDPEALSLLAGNPFPERPPRWIRARLYRYAFAEPGDADGDWWRRKLLGEWLPPLSADDPRLWRLNDGRRWRP